MTSMTNLVRFPFSAKQLGSLNSWTRLAAAVWLSWLALLPNAAMAQETTPPVAEQTDSARIERLAQFLTGVKLTGHFTVKGRETDRLTPEEYFILSAEKGAEGDYWTLTARVKYGGKDFTLPLVLEIKWAGNTPVITVDRLTIPGMGTFDARVLLRPDAYAGTWQHDDVGGHLFGTIEKLTETELNELKNRVQRSGDKQ